MVLHLHRILKTVRYLIFLNYTSPFLFSSIRYYNERGDAVAKASKQPHVVSTSQIVTG